MTPERNPGIPTELAFLIENYALTFLHLGRIGWDEPHTRAVVYYTGVIAEAEGLDSLVLVSTGWLHDTGYYALFEEGDSTDYAEVMDRKKAHMINGARLARKFLTQSNVRPFYNTEQANRVEHLVLVHDQIEKLNDRDEIAFMEADTLGAIDIARVASTFDRENAIKYIENDLMTRRFPRFMTSVGKDFFEKLIVPFKAQYGF